MLLKLIITDEFDRVLADKEVLLEKTNKGYELPDYFGVITIIDDATEVFNYYNKHEKVDNSSFIMRINKKKERLNI